MLEHISSLQNHFLQLYISREPQCKLNYDSSPQCDSFQLGEMIRFFTRKGTLSLQSTFAGTHEGMAPFDGDILELVRMLRECPSYQIDSNHKHCGLRTRFVPRLEHIKPWSQVGLCLHCWKRAQASESWLENPNKEEWRFCRHTFNVELSLCGADHKKARLMYTACKRDWTRPG